MGKKLNFLCPLIFCLFLYGMSAALFLSDTTEYSSKEKRYLAKEPEISFQGIIDGTSQKELEAWVEDQFPMRDTYVALNSYWMLGSGRNVQQSIYFAKDGHLIKEPASEDLSIFQTTLTRFDTFAGACGVPTTLILVPDNGWIHSDLLPFGSKMYTDDSCFDTAENVLENVKFLDFRQTLLEADQQAPVSYKTDHHLSAWGNYSLYRAWCAEKNVTPREKHNYVLETIPNFYGTAWSGSGYWLTPPDELEIWDSGCEVTVTITDGGEEPVTTNSLFYRDHLNELDKYPVYLDGNHCQVEISNPAADGGTLLMIKDSYAHCFATFLAEHYSKIIMLDLRYYRGSISDYMIQNKVDELMFFYGTSTLLTDTNSAWLF